MMSEAQDFESRRLTLSTFMLHTPFFNAGLKRENSQSENIGRSSNLARMQTEDVLLYRDRVANIGQRM
jgi:hypothetical protein